MEEHFSSTEGNEDELKLDTLIAQLREMLKDDPSSWKRDDEFLAKFIRVKGYDVKRALTGVRKYYSNIQRHLDLVLNIRPTQFQSFYEDEVGTFLRGRCQKGSKVIFLQACTWDVKKHGIRTLQLSSVLALEEALQHITNQLSGFSIIIDLGQLSFAHLKQATPKKMYETLDFDQDGLPLRVVGIHYINFPLIFWGLFCLIRGFMKEKLRNRIHLHNSLESLHGHMFMVMLNSVLNPLVVGLSMGRQQTLNSTLTCYEMIRVIKNITALQMWSRPEFKKKTKWIIPPVSNCEPLLKFVN